MNYSRLSNFDNKACVVNGDLRKKEDEKSYDETINNINILKSYEDQIEFVKLINNGNRTFSRETNNRCHKKLTIKRSVEKCNKKYVTAYKQELSKKDYINIYNQVAIKCKNLVGESGIRFSIELADKQKINIAINNHTSGSCCVSMVAQNNFLANKLLKSRKKMINSIGLVMGKKIILNVSLMAGV